PRPPPCAPAGTWWSSPTPRHRRGRGRTARSCSPPGTTPPSWTSPRTNGSSRRPASPAAPRPGPTGSTPGCSTQCWWRGGARGRAPFAQGPVSAAGGPRLRVPLERGLRVVRGGAVHADLEGVGHLLGGAQRPAVHPPAGGVLGLDRFGGQPLPAAQQRRGAGALEQGIQALRVLVLHRQAVHDHAARDLLPQARKTTR